MPGLEAARLGDEIGHTSALAGLIIGAVAAAAIAVAVVAIVGTGGMAAVAVGAGIAAAAAGGGLGGAYIGELIPTSPTGTILTGSSNVFVGSLPLLSARAGMDTSACSGVMAPHATPLIAQGSSTVFINRMMAARRTDKLVCGAAIAKGCSTVFIGGPTANVPGLTIESDVPDWLRNTLVVVAIVGAIIATGGAAAAFGVGPALGGLLGGIIGAQVLGAAGGLVGEIIGEAFGNAELGERIGEVAGGFIGGLLGGVAGAKVGGSGVPGGETPPPDTEPPSAAPDTEPTGPTSAEREDSLATEDGKITPQGRREARGVLSAEREGELDPGSAIRPESAGRTSRGFDYEATQNGQPVDVDVKSPNANYPRPLTGGPPSQANDIAVKSSLYPQGTKVVVDLADVPPSQQAAFKQDIINHGGDPNKLIFVNEAPNP